MITDERLAAWERLAGIQNPDWPDAYQAQHALRELLPLFRQLRADRERERAVAEFVRSLEHVTDDGDDWEFCGICHNYLTRHPEAGHAKDCRLVPVLAALQAAGEPGGEVG